jgi:hypothetical protein
MFSNKITMTYKDAVKEFNQLFPKKNYTKNGFYDKIMRKEDWLNWTDSLCKEGRITPTQYETWKSPIKD